VRVGQELRPAPAHLLAFVGRLQPLKGPDVAVRTLAELRAGRPDLDVELLVVGGPSGNGQDEPERLTALAAELGIADRVHFMAAQPREPLADVYRAADLLLVPSRSESFGLVALEAQACGTPVLATRVGGLAWAVGDATTGLLLPDRDPVRWAAAAAGLLGNPRRLAAMSQAAAQFSRARGWGETAERLLGIYRDLTDAADGAVLERTS
jgi:D-inositol-3-phosphate glycosyltransferase